MLILLLLWISNNVRSRGQKHILCDRKLDRCTEFQACQILISINNYIKKIPELTKLNSFAPHSNMHHYAGYPSRMNIFTIDNFNIIIFWALISVISFLTVKESFLEKLKYETTIFFFLIGKLNP